MKRSLQLMLCFTVILALLGLALPPSAAQDEPAIPQILVYNVWARPAATMDMGSDPMATPEAGMDATPAGDMGMAAMVTSAAYMQIENASDQPVTLVAAASDVAEAVEIHEVKMVDNVMQMRPVEGGIAIPAGETVALAPGGYHVMLIGVKDTLEPGDAFPLTLTFAYGEAIKEDVVVAALVREEPPTEESPILVYGDWARAVVGGDGVTSAAYLTLDNRGNDPDRLMSVATEAAGVAEIHEMTMDGEVMQMRPVEGGLEIPAGATVELAPGGYHVMLIGVPEDLEVGQAIVLTLTFESGLELQVAVPVRDQMDMMGDMSN